MENHQAITLREMTIEDYEQAFSIWEQSDGICINESDSRENIWLFLQRNPGLSVVAENGGKIVGTVLGGHDGRVGMIYHLAVMLPYRGQGIAWMLVEECLRRLSEVGLHRCYIHVLRDNQPAIEFWGKNNCQLREDYHVFFRELQDEQERQQEGGGNTESRNG